MKKEVNSYTKRLQLLVRKILENATDYDWSVQGLGMLRLYLGKEGRLHIWDQELEYPNVSKIHNHSWKMLESQVICGQLINTRYREVSTNDNDFIKSRAEFYWKRKLRCGVGCKFITEPEKILLYSSSIEIYENGQTYTQYSNEIHESFGIAGTTTLMLREEDGPEGTADIFWKEGTEWGTAEPRKATFEEIEKTTSKALKLMENS